VPDEVIPPGGRDVQCSNCGDTWFQQHPQYAAPQEADDDPSVAASSKRREPAPASAAASAPETPLGDNFEEYPADSDWGDASAATPAEPAPPQRPHVDPAVAEILREEAALETSARAAQAAGTIETQPDLGLRPPPQGNDERGRLARNRIERLRGETEPATASSPHAASNRSDIDPTTRRNFLPDIEEITSSLTGFDLVEEPAKPDFEEEPEPPIRRSGFRSGFRLAALVFLLATTVYVLAPRIADQVPAAAAPLAQFVKAVDSGRLWLDARVSAVMIWITEAATPKAPDGN